MGGQPERRDRVLTDCQNVKLLKILQEGKSNVITMLGTSSDLEGTCVKAGLLHCICFMVPQFLLSSLCQGFLPLLLAMYGVGGPSSVQTLNLKLTLLKKINYFPLDI